MPLNSSVNYAPYNGAIEHTQGDFKMRLQECYGKVNSFAEFTLIVNLAIGIVTKSGQKKVKSTAWRVACRKWLEKNAFTVNTTPVSLLDQALLLQCVFYPAIATAVSLLLISTVKMLNVEIGKLLFIKPADIQNFIKRCPMVGCLINRLSESPSRPSYLTVSKSTAKNK